MKIMSLSNHASSFLYYWFGASAFTFEDDAVFTSFFLFFLDIEICQIVEMFKFNSFNGPWILQTFIKIHSADPGQILQIFIKIHSDDTRFCGLLLTSV